ncbi:cupin domain-containing protein [candidate division WOR-3 bacterium]|nr:cupin domain-containing protein [candidate division WOR-3 bacterium]
MLIKNLSELKEKEVVPGVKGKFLHSKNMTIVYWTIDAGAVMPDHAHPHEQVVNVLEGEFDLIIEGEVNAVKPGSVAVVPPDITHGGRAKTDCRLIDVFYPVREDYRN